MRGTIDGTDIYLEDNQLPAFTSSIDSILDPSKIKGVGSTTMKVVTTKEARQVLGTEFMSQHTSNARRVLRISQGDVDLFRADVIPVSIDRNVAECIGVGGNASWFEHAKRTKIGEIGFGESDPLTDTYIEGTWTDPEDLLYFPLIDFGYLTDRASTFNVARWFLRPGLRAHKVLEAGFALIGYQVEAKGSLAGWWKKFIVHQPSEALTPHFYGSPTGCTVRPSGSSSYTLTDVGSGGNEYPLTDEVLDPSSAYASNHYTPSASGTMDVRVDHLGILVDPFAEPASGEIFFLHVWNVTTNAPVATKTQAYVTGEFAVLWHHSFLAVPMVAGNEYAFVVQRMSGGYSGSTSIQAVCIATFCPTDPFFSASYFAWNQEDISTFLLDGVQMPIQVDSICPDMYLLDVLTGIASDQCLVFVTDTFNKRVHVWLEDEYRRRPNNVQAFRDWTDRMDHTVAPAKVRPAFPARLLFRWEDDDSDNDLSKALVRSAYPKYGNEDVVLDGYGKEQAVKLPFAQTVMGEVCDGLVVPVMRQKGGEYQADDYDRKVRLLIADGVASGTWKMDLSTKSTYPNCYFTTADPNGVPIHWGNATAGYAGTVSAHWVTRLALMRQQRTLEAHLFIRDHELQDFDHGLPTLVDDGSGPAWYWVQEIQQHRFGVHQPTKCILVQIPGKEVSMPAVEQPQIEYPAQPFLCVGPGYVSFSVVGGTAIVNLTTTTGYYSIRQSNGTITTYDSEEQSDDLLSGTYCAWASDASGGYVGAEMITDIGAGGDGLDDIALAGLAGDALEKIQVLSSALKSLTIPDAPNLTHLEAQDNPDLEEVLLSGAIPSVQFAYLGGNALTEVDTLINALPLAVLGGTADFATGTNAAPTGASAAHLAQLTAGPLMSIADTGNANIDGDYDPNGTLNGKDAYIHAVNGITEVFWTGAQWRTLAADAILDSYDAVAQPWLATTWILVSGTASDPTITAPGSNWTITTN